MAVASRMTVCRMLASPTKIAFRYLPEHIFNNVIGVIDVVHATLLSEDLCEDVATERHYIIVDEMKAAMWRTTRRQHRPPHWDGPTPAELQIRQDAYATRITARNLLREADLRLL